MTPSELLSCAPRIAPSKLARIRLLKCKSLGTLVPPGRDGKFLTIALDGKRGPPVRRLPKDVELVEQAAPPPPKLEPQCVNCGAVATLKCSACAAVWSLRARAGGGTAQGEHLLAGVREGAVGDTQAGVPRSAGGEDGEGLGAGEQQSCDVHVCHA